jgi:hypothetical protein
MQSQNVGNDIVPSNGCHTIYVEKQSHHEGNPSALMVNDVSVHLLAVDDLQSVKDLKKERLSF